jgi:hypothetical protein
MPRLSCLALVAYLSVVVTSLGFPTGSAAPITPDIDYNALLDGSLGPLPSLWLVSQGTLFELSKTNETCARLVARNNSTNPTPDPEGREDKENGIATAVFISGMLIPQAFAIKDSSPTTALCKSLMRSSAGMVGAVVGQEVAKDLYSNNSTSSEFEQGVIPGLFFGSVVGNGAGEALSRSICRHLVPDFTKWWKAMHPDQVTRVAQTFNHSLQSLLTEHLQSLRVETSRAVQFASQLTETVRAGDMLHRVQAFERLQSDMVSVGTELSRGIARAVGNNASPPATPALDALVRISSQSLSFMGTPNTMPPFDLPQTPLNPLKSFPNHMSHVNDWARKVPGAKKVASSLKEVVDGLREGMKSAEALLQSGATQQTSEALHRASDAARGGSSVQH